MRLRIETRPRRAGAAALLATLLTLALAASAQKPPAGQKGIASYYHDALHGRDTASGERYDSKRYTAAHRRLPIGTRVRVTNLHTEKSVVVRINDRGPFVRGRIIDVSRRAARDLGMLKTGLAPVRVDVIALPAPDQS